MNRIQINGEWYVKEDQSNETQKLIDESNITHFKGCVYENDDYAWEATIIQKTDSEEYYDGVDIKFTDKRCKPWKEDHWDSNSWMVGVYNDDKYSLTDAQKLMDKKGIETFKEFIGYLIELNYIKK